MAAPLISASLTEQHKLKEIKIKQSENERFISDCLFLICKREGYSVSALRIWGGQEAI